MKKLSLLILVISHSLITNGITVNVNITAGGLENALVSKGINIFYDVTSLTISGGINSSDISIMSFMSNLTLIDVTNASFIPDDVVPVFAGKHVFSSGGAVSTIILSSNAKYISPTAFNSFGTLKSVLFPVNSVLDTIGSSAFKGCSVLESINLPSTVTKIGSECFSGCSKLNSITIPNGISYIGNKAFNSCIGLSSVYIKKITPLVLDPQSLIFEGVNKENCFLYVPQGSKSRYSQANIWKDFKQIVEEVNINTYNQTDTKSLVEIIYKNETLNCLGFNGISEMLVFNGNGLLIFSKQIKNNESIYLGSLPNGIYLVKLTTNGGTIERKIVKN